MRCALILLVLSLQSHAEQPGRPQLARNWSLVRKWWHVMKYAGSLFCRQSLTLFPVSESLSLEYIPNPKAVSFKISDSLLAM